MKYLAFLVFVLTIACTPQNNREMAIKEIEEAEAAFAQMVADSGVAAGFMHFAANDAVMLRNENLVKGKEAFQEYFSHSTLTNVQLAWQPDFVDAAESGELGYTYGTYTFSATDTAGKELSSQGIFHSVWRKQADGQWRFVWD